MGVGGGGVTDKMQHHARSQVIIIGDVAQFVAQHFDHCNAAYRCRQEYRPRLTTFDLFFTTISKTTK